MTKMKSDSSISVGVIIIYCLIWLLVFGFAFLLSSIVFFGTAIDLGMRGTPAGAIESIGKTVAMILIIVGIFTVSCRFTFACRTWLLPYKVKPSIFGNIIGLFFYLLLIFIPFPIGIATFTYLSDYVSFNYDSLSTAERYMIAALMFIGIIATFAICFWSASVIKSRQQKEISKQS